MSDETKKRAHDSQIVRAKEKSQVSETDCIIRFTQIIQIIIYPPDKSAYLKNYFLISQPKHMLWVLKRTVGTHNTDLH